MFPQEAGRKKTIIWDNYQDFLLNNFKRLSMGFLLNLAAVSFENSKNLSLSWDEKYWSINNL